MDCRPPGSSVHGILQTRIHHWVNACLWSLWSVTNLSETVCWLSTGSWSLWPVTDLSEAVHWVNAGSRSLCSVTDLPVVIPCLSAGAWSLWPHSHHRAVERHCVAATAVGPLAYCCCPQARSGECQSHREATFRLYVSSQELVFQVKQVIRGSLH